MRSGRFRSEARCRQRAFSPASGTGILPPDVVEQIRSSNDAWHRRDLEATLAPYADEIEWNTTEDGKILRARNFTSLDAAMESLAGAGLTRIWKPPGD